MGDFTVEKWPRPLGAATAACPAQCFSTNTMTTAMKTATMKVSHRGLSTHSQLHVMTPVSFSATNSRVSASKKPSPTVLISF